MKRILIALAMIAYVTVGYAQPKGGSASVQAAVQAAEKEAADAKKAKKVATWMKLGDAYMAAYSASTGNAWVGATPTDLALVLRNAKPVSEEQIVVKGQTFTKASYGTYDYYFDGAGNVVAMQATKPLVADALSKAAEAYKQAYAVDTKASKKKEISAAIKSISDKFVDEAYSAYTLDQMANASQAFEKAALIAEYEPYATKDGDLYYNAGFTAYEAADYQRAKNLFQKCLDIDYFKDGDVYAKLGDTYGKLGDKELMKDTYESAFAKFPESESILVSLINYYVSEKADTDRLFELIAAAKAKDPQNVSLYYVEGNVHSQLGDIEAARKCYQQCAQIDPNYVFGYIGEGMMLYDQAVKIQEEAQEELDDSKYATLVENFENSLKSCIAPFEKAFEISDDNELKVSVAEYLKNACFRFREESADYQAKYDKYNKVVAEGL